MKIKAVIFGATGHVGQGVLIGCLEHPDVEKILVIGRKSCGIQHEKLEEIIHTDFKDYSAIKNQLSGYNACYFCLGVSSIGAKEAEYRVITVDYPLAAAETLVALNPDMTFIYVSGVGTDATQKSNTMWKRVKGEAETRILALPFKQAFAFRPGIIEPRKGIKPTLAFYKWGKPLLPILKIFFSSMFTSSDKVGLAMIHATQQGYVTHTIENEDINVLASR